MADLGGEYLNQALADFSGYIAADELYDGPFCVLSLVDNHTFKRRVYEVLDHDPTSRDMAAFFRRFQAALDARGLRVAGIPTDGSPPYPVPIHDVFGAIPHQIGAFHVRKEIPAAVLHAVAKVRKTLAGTAPKLPRGRPTKAARRTARRAQRIQDRIGAPFEHRHLFVQHDLTPGQHRTLGRLTRGLPHLRTLRQVMDQTYRLFDRRCRSETALAKPAQLRGRVRRFKKVGRTLPRRFSPNLEKALTFLDDALLPATSNAVERGTRRHRKMHTTVYCVRTAAALWARIALDRYRDQRAPARGNALLTLHTARAGAL